MDSWLLLDSEIGDKVDYAIVMPYIGGCLSVNAMKIVRAGRRTHRNFPEVDDWMFELASKVEHLRGKFKLPIRVRLFGKFRDNRHPDLHNLHKIIGDGLERGLGVNDKDILISDEGFELGHMDQELVITLGEG